MILLFYFCVYQFVGLQFGFCFFVMGVVYGNEVYGMKVMIEIICQFDVGELMFLCGMLMLVFIVNLLVYQLGCCEGDCNFNCNLCLFVVVYDFEDCIVCVLCLLIVQYDGIFDLYSFQG